jgi:mono/diheme cytochrome c family protein
MRRLARSLALVAAAAAPASAQAPEGAFTDPVHFHVQGGAALYRDVCQGCHMADGKGAVGAGTFPALAGDPKLAAAGYPLAVVMNGQKGMPGFARALSDAQVAAVVNYVRSHFGNAYGDTVSDADVTAQR